MQKACQRVGLMLVADLAALPGQCDPTAGDLFNRACRFYNRVKICRAGAIRYPSTTRGRAAVFPAPESTGGWLEARSCAAADIVRACALLAGRAIHLAKHRVG